jgi:hypothetical protein
MSNRQPSPGTWRASINRLDPNIVTTEPTNAVVVIGKAISYIGFEKEAEANALLFAASKEMFGILKKIVGAPNYPGWVNDVKSVIAKAEGDKHERATLPIQDSRISD